MKFLISLLGCMLCMCPFLFAQPDKSVLQLPEIAIGSQMDIHLLSPEPIQYADISTHSIAGDLPVKNMMRIKIIPDSLKLHFNDHQPLGVLTLVGESFICQYRLVFAANPNTSVLRSQINIMPEDCQPLDFPGIHLTSNDRKRYALGLLQVGNRSSVRKAKAYGLQASLNHVYTAGDEVFLDISFLNKTNLPYSPDELRFKIEDKKITKATNNQSVELKPFWQLYPLSDFKKQFHNIYVFPKVTFPDNKVLNVELSEKQVSGRTIRLSIKYSDILHADTL
jgi:conjugative transposon TraN protein